MKLYHAPDTCSLAAYIALREAGIAFDPVEVDIRTRRLRDGVDYAAINPKGCVPALVLDTGTVLTENVAILDWISHQAPALAPADPPARTCQVELLAFLVAEVQKPFILYFILPEAGARDFMFGRVRDRLDWLATRLHASHLRGEAFGVADAHLYVMLRWARMAQMPVADNMAAYRDRIEKRPATRRALQEQGLH